MAILLHNLQVRSPKLKDSADVAALLIACDMAEDGVSDYSDYKEEDVLLGWQTAWQRSGFNLEKDAWVIVTFKGLLVGYADVWVGQDAQIEMREHVHPQYRGRGIGTFLLRMAEERARQHARQQDSSARVTLQSAVNHANQVAQQLLEHEGYLPLQHFWRLTLNTDEPSHGLSRSGKVTFDLPIGGQLSGDMVGSHRRTGIYAARRYHLYEKELRAGELLYTSGDLVAQAVDV
jgi:GNAT superfamily N-acetyltransferase